MDKTVLALVPHPDDAEYHTGGLLANFAAQGSRIILVIATDGRCGSYEMSGGDLVRTRAEEARRAARILGAEPPLLLEYPDFEADRIRPGELREKFIRLVRQYRPDVTISEDPDGLLETHPDHKVVAKAAFEAILYAQLPLIEPQHLTEGLREHFVTEKFYWTDPQANPNKIVDISETIDRKIAALAEHASQVRFLVEGIARQAQAAGFELSAALGPAAGDPLSALSWAIRAQAEEAGATAGYHYAELYRYERYHPLVESFLSRTEEFHQ